MLKSVETAYSACMECLLAFFVVKQGYLWSSEHKVFQIKEVGTMHWQNSGGGVHIFRCCWICPLWF